MLAPEDVRFWWVLGGTGHVLLSECTCGRCPDRWESLCGLKGSEGFKSDRMPAGICPDCRGRLAAKAIAPADYRARRMRGPGA